MTRASGDGSLIAVVGISCRLPHAPDPEAYWQLLASGRDAISALPGERRELAGLPPGEPLEDEPATLLGGFLAGVDRFDPAFFGISPREAAAMDPQQRLALELAWEALEDGGIAASAIRGSAAGVFLGAIAGDYASLVDRRGSEAIGRHTVVGLHRSIIANRISYVLGLGGPSLTVDAAQSASLVAVHLACESLRRGESRLALAGGVHLNLDPRGAFGAARIGGLSPDGRCFTFDARANGFVRGEGGGVVVLKPLAEARADGDRVYCVIRGSAVNNDGGGASLTAPSQAAQEAVIRAAYRRAGVKRSELQYVELHGSGTPTGDPIEAAALGGALGGEAGAPLPVGSAKTNIGHLEGAAGIAGLIKVALAIDRRQIPASLNFERPNPAIPLDELGLRVQRRLGDWPRDDRPLLAGVSSFGVGGTNCHVVLSETLPGNQKKPTKPKNASDGEATDTAPPLPAATPLLLSAASPAALRAQAERLGSRLEQDQQLDLDDVGYSLATTRSHLRQRAAIIAPDRERLLGALGSLAAGDDDDGVLSGAAGAAGSPVFLFPGQGSQWVGMGVELAESSSLFRGYLEECEAALAPHIDFALMDALSGAGGAASLDRVDVIQPALFAVMVSLARLWRRCGVEPAAVVGHSQGEVAAAHIAGGLSLEDAALISAVRSRLIQERAGEGGMISVALSDRSLAPLLEPFGDRLAVAAQNGPAAAIVCGDRRALDQLLEACAARDVRARDLAGGIFASHSAYVEPMREDLLEALAPVSPRSGEVPFHSTVTGGLLDTGELGAEYWYRNLRQQVRFEPVTRQLLEGGRRLFLEISAHPVFAVAVGETIEAVLDDPEEATVLATLRRDQGGPESFTRSLAEAHVAGVAVEWERHFSAAKRVALPTYPFQRQRYWLDGAIAEGGGEALAPADDDAPAAVDADADDGLASELRGLPAAERQGRALALVRAEVAKVLGAASAEGVEPGRAFKDLGFDSAAAADLRKRLRRASGLRIGSTAVFDHPSASALARHLVALATGEERGPVAVRARSSAEPIAIVGMACRLPGAASPRLLWRLLAEGIDATSEFPADRGWELARLYDPDPDRPDTTYVSRGGFLADAGDFDAEFFDLSPRESLAMDPQQRLLLEASWEALEAAGLDPDRLRGTATGVFSGISSQDYSAGLRGSGDSLEGYRLTGSATSVASGRVSYALGLEGPAITVDTACSSSLVAMHLAAGALRGGECSLALAGGGTVLGSPGVFTEFSRQRGLAPDGRCKSFAEAADGTAWSEGVGVLVLERLSDAEANGHRVLATIKGSAVNQDGASNGLTAPNGPSQERVIRQALANAGLKPSDVELVEAHGTGTALGDPIEAGALLATYGQDRETPVRLGSLKSNIGHAQAAAGVAGVIKAVMAIREARMPKTLHVDAPSSKVEWETGAVELLSEATPWPAGERPRRAAVSSFGISGTNAHMILEEAPAPAATGTESAGAGSGPEAEQPLIGPLPLVLSAKSEPALAAQAERLAAHLREDPGAELTDVAHSLTAGRSSFEQRAVCLAGSREEALQALDSLAAGAAEAPGVYRGTVRERAKAALLFPGQGSQWQGMGLELIDSSPAFAASMGECEEALAPYLDFSLRDVLKGAPGAPVLEHVEVVQPALFAVLVSLARLWQACGLEVAAVAGHSQGEIAAAHIAGGLSLEDAARLAALRAKLIARIAGQGGMVSLIASPERVQSLIEPFGGAIEVAAHNGPSATVVSGGSEALEELLGSCEAEQGVRARAVAVDYASHSQHVEVLREEILSTFADISPRSGEIPFHSTVTGEVLDTAELGAEYWYRNLRQPVLFEQVSRGLIESGHGALVEVSPHPVFTLPLGETIERAGAEGAAVIETLRREQGGAKRFVASLARAHAAGAPIAWSEFFAGSGAKTVPLPTYPFQRKRYWLNVLGGGGTDPAAIGQRALEHPFLAAAIEDPEGDGVAFSGRISLSEHPWLADHAVLDTAIFPGTGFLELALFAGAQAGAPAVAELTLQAPLVLSDAAVALRVSVAAADGAGRCEIAIHSRPEGEEEEGWTRNAAGLLSARTGELPAPPSQWPAKGAEPIEPGDLHARLAEAGFEYGPAFQGLTAAWGVGDEIYAEVSLPEGPAGESGGFAVHPALLDAALHPIALGKGEGVSLPFAWNGAHFESSGGRELRVRLIGNGEEGTEIQLFDAGGTPLGQVDSLQARPLEAERLRGGESGSLHRLRWVKPAPSQLTHPPAETWRVPRPGPGAEAAREATTAALGKIQQWLATESEDARLAILTEAALAAGVGDSPDPAAAAVCGLVRSATAEHPGRFLLVDSDGSEASEAALEEAFAADPGEAQIALREGELLVPRLVRADQPAEPAPALDPERTVLITGATGGLGSLVARHLAEAHGARHLLLVSRSGEWARGAGELRADLTALGVTVEIAACDVSDREQLEGLLGEIPGEHPLGAVIHCAAVLDDATVEEASAEQLEHVFAPKADAAWHLHELTADLDLSHFVCFSSIAGIVGSPGQGAYAAANCFLDALAVQRRAQGLPASAVAWGLWARESAMLGELGEADLARMRRAGIEALSEQQGLALFDAALAGCEPLVAAVRLDRPALRAQAGAGSLPAIFAELVPAARRAGSSLAARLATAPEDERPARVLELVRSEVAVVLGHGSAGAVDPDKPFKELGFDSLAAVELRNRLKGSTGLSLAPTTVFDYPTAATLAAHLLAEVAPGGRARDRLVKVQTSEEPIAIVGMGCHMPGGVDSPEQLWQLVAEGREGIVPFPADRGWDLERVYDPDPGHAGTSYVREGGFLRDPARFDADFFSIAPREAIAMDPQQRLLLETSWEALEDAGIDPGGLKGQPVGVFAGAAKGDYSSAVEGYAMIGGQASILAGRVSYTLGLEGPALTVDTACSSSLVAMHLAVGALHGGECSLALAGGVTIHSTPEMFVDFSRQRVLSADGRSKAFAEGANGAGFAEGIGMLVLERLSDAEANGHRVLATIRGSAINQDGASNGLTAPNGPSQERVIRQALGSAGLGPEEVDAVEAHGTGTPLGDPIEVGALIATYGRQRELPLKLGSIKSNIGHTMAAAGVAGVIKMTMAMRAGVLPKTLHAEDPSPAIEWSSAGIDLLNEPLEWEQAGRPRRAGISSFGISGTNAHLILEEAPASAVTEAGPVGEDATPATEQPLTDALPLLLSAKSEAALAAQAERLAAQIEADPEAELADLAYSLATTRPAFEQRAAVLATSRRQALESLGALAVGSGDESVLRGAASERTKAALLFPGQGSQWQGMGLQLIESSPAFANSMDECEEALAPYLDFSLRDVLRGSEGAPSLERIEVVQPALFAVMVSLARLWQACGLKPTAVAGHSQGEIAAAHIAGGLSLDDAARLAALRSQLISKLAGKGSLVSLIAPRERVSSLIEPWQGEIEVAAHNGPSSTIVSGTREALDGLLAHCEKEEEAGVRAREVPAAIASHSHHVEALREEVLETFADISPRSGEIPFHSTVTGEVLDTAELGAEYWYRNLRQPVLFEQVSRGLIESGHGALVEVSPHPVFILAVGETVERSGTDATVVETLRRDDGAPARFAASLCQAHLAGAPVRWSEFFAGSGAEAVSLPTYPFQRERFWLAAASGAADPAAIGQSALDHPFLAAAIEEPEGDAVAFSGRISLSEHPWLADHAVLDTAIFPGTGFLDLALVAAAQVDLPTVAELTLQAPLVLTDAATALRVTVAAPDQDGRREIGIHSRPAQAEGQGWTRHASGVLSPRAAQPADAVAAWPPPAATALELEDLRARLAEAGFEYGPAFGGLGAAWRVGEDVYAEVSLPEAQAGGSGFAVHPALLDAALHPIALGAGEGVRLPFSWSGVCLYAAAGSELRVRLRGGEDVGLTLFDGVGTPIGEVDSLRARPLDPGQLQGGDAAPLFELRWEALAPFRAAPLQTELWRAPRVGGGAEAAREATIAALEKVQDWLSSEPGDSRLAILTEAAVALTGADSPDLAAAAVWGLVRSAASEHPGRFLLIDSDGSEASEAALEQALAADPRESQIALREGELLVPRLARAKDEEGEPAQPLDPERTVLITGATGGIGALVARHLVESHGARRLLLVSRSGEEAPGAPELGARLRELGAEVRIAACDVSERSQLENLLGSIPGEHPLGAVIHCAAALDDGLVESLDQEGLARVFGPKADGAWQLHELTADLGLSHFVLFSSLAGILGSPGQGSYAAANCFLDALAAQRRARGLAAGSIAWGLWSSESAMAGQLEQADLARMRRAGVEALSAEQGLALFDRALAADLPLAAALRLDRAALRAEAAAGVLPALLEGVAGARAKAGGGGAAALSSRLRKAPEAVRGRLAEDFVRAEVATILGHASAEAVGPNDSFKDLGFDSLAAVELRNRLNLASGLQLPATVVFDYPDAAALSGKVLAEISGSGGARPAAVQARSSAEPIAIVGMACRYPGGVSSPAELWQLVGAGSDAVGELPTDRGWDQASIYVLDPERPELGYRHAGGFLPDAGEFDPGFFGISPREAVSIDPQQRLALESSWEALEDAGIDPHRLRGSATGVFTGVMHHDYGVAVSDSSGMAAGAASGRVSYALGLEGPAMTVDTACSSSLVAMHLAAGALRGGECSLALAGGATVLATPAVFGYFSRQQGLARDGRCKAFSDEADGVGISEGVGVLVLERLSDAERNGHRVLATIKGSAVNQDGASNGLTAPNGPSQERVIRQALANAGLKPSDVELVEAHGTGTSLGDPIEAGALLATYGQERETPVKLGSLKSNIGHAQAAAGVAGVIKAVMAIREAQMPKTLHVDAPSSKVEWEAGKVELLSEALEWEADGHPRRAGVSSFGATGTNAHLIVEEAPRPAPVGESAEDAPAGTPAASPLLSGPFPLLLSARSPAALAAQAKRLATQLREDPEQSLADAAYSLATTRAQLEQRAVVVGSERKEILATLEALAREEQPAGALLGKALPGAKLAYLFSGQGSQRPGMGRELYEAHPAYAEAFDLSCAEIDPQIGRSLAALVFSEPGSPEAELLEHTSCAQPALFATELALYRLLESLGLVPELLCGHSVGEITAAHVAGVLSLPDAAKLVCARGALMGELPEGGAMVAIEATEAEILTSLEGKEAEVSLAAVNSPSSCVVSGRREAVEEIEAQWRAEGRKAKRLAVSHAFHSPLMEPMLEPFAELTAGLVYAEPKLPIVSCLSGELLSAEQATDPAHWVAHARQPVRFADAIAALRSEGAGAFVELGPDPVLCAMARECLEGEAALAPTLREGRAEAETLLGALATAHVAGAPLDWEAFFAGSGARAVPLPTYPFQRRRYWLDPASASSDPSAIGQRAIEHPFLAAAIEDPEGEGIAFSGRVSLREHPWLSDHAVLGSALLPGTAFLEAALFAGTQAGAPTVVELTLQAPLVLTEAAVALRVSVGAPDEEGKREIAIHSRPEGEEGAQWTRNAAGILSAEVLAGPDPLPAWPPPGAEPVSPDQLHARLADAGFEYGAAFQGLSAVWREGSELYAEVSLPAERAEEAASFGIHPALLDAALQPLALEAGEGLSLPFSWNGASLAPTGAHELRARISAGGEQGTGIELFDAIGTPIGQIDALLARPLDPGQLRGGAVAPLFGLRWVKPAASREAPDAELWRAPRPGATAEAAREATLATLEKIQHWLGSEPRESRLAILTEGALTTSEGDSPEPAAAALSGLVAAAASEHPGRLLLVDSDGSEASEAALPDALGADPREARLALRDGELLVPRLAPVASGEDESERALDPEATVLITGATGGLGALVAAHLAESHGARRLLLVSRSGERAAGAAELLAQLQELGAEARIAACDVSERAQLEDLLASIPSEHPLGAIVHCAGIVDDATIETASAEQLERVFGPKADAAWHLHELTADLELSHFVLFSSLAGTLGSAGQGAYAAANCFLDGLAVHRRALGLPAASIAWGLWARESAMVDQLGEADLARMQRAGIEALSAAQGLALFDRALAEGPAQTAAVRFDRAALRAQAGAGSLPALLEGMVAVSARAGGGAAGTLSRRLREAPESARARLAEDFVRAEVAAILGHPSAESVGPADSFKDLGFDSLAAIELRNRLGVATGQRLAASVVFDYPTAAALAGHLLEQEGDVEAVAAPELGRLERALAGLSDGDPERGKLAARLRALAAELERSAETNGDSAAARLEQASDEELLEFIDTQVGSSRG